MSIDIKLTGIDEAIEKYNADILAKASDRHLSLINPHCRLDWRSKKL